MKLAGGCAACSYDAVAMLASAWLMAQGYVLACTYSVSIGISVTCLQTPCAYRAVEWHVALMFTDSL